MRQISQLKQIFAQNKTIFTKWYFLINLSKNFFLHFLYLLYQIRFCYISLLIACLVASGHNTNRSFYLSIPHFCCCMYTAIIEVVQELPHPHQQTGGQFQYTSHQATELLIYLTVYFVHQCTLCTCISQPVQYSIFSNLYLFILFFSHIVTSMLLFVG